MPIYEYECASCEITQEEFTTKISDQPETVLCKQCGKPIQRIMSQNTFVLKGMCWEKDGYCGKAESKGH